MLRLLILSLALPLASAAIAQEGEASVELGAHLAIIGGCHDCHTTGYNTSNGQIDPERAMRGDTVGFQGPWGTTYPANLRIKAAERSEDDWVQYLGTLEARPPMPWFNLRALSDTDMRSLHRYIVSLGDPGDPAPEFVPPGEAPKTPFIIFAPPQMPAQ